MVQRYNAAYLLSKRMSRASLKASATGAVSIKIEVSRVVRGRWGASNC